MVLPGQWPEPPGGATIEHLAADAVLLRAWDRVRHNQGAPGVDGETIEAFGAALWERLPLVQADLLAGTFRPHPVRAFQISKPSGGVRVLGIPTVGDRVVLQAMSQILAPLWEPGFSPFSFAYRPGHGAREAVATAQRILQTGFRWVAELDVEKFFDRVDHVHLMLRLRQRVEDARLLDLIADFLRAGQSWPGELRPTKCGLAQGSPLSPLLANIVLDELDAEFSRRGWAFVRYADDCIVFARSEEEAHDMLQTTDSFLWSVLRLRLNSAKSRVVPPADTDHLGFAYRISRYGRVSPGVARRPLVAFRERIDALTRPRPGGATWEEIGRQVAAYVRGWSIYYGGAEDDTMKTARAYARSRLRACAWEMWRTPDIRCRELERRGIPGAVAARAAGALVMPDQLPDLPVLGKALPNRCFENLGLGDPPARAKLCRRQGQSGAGFGTFDRLRLAPEVHPVLPDDPAVSLPSLDEASFL